MTAEQKIFFSSRISWVKHSILSADRKEQSFHLKSPKNPSTDEETAQMTDE